MTIELLELYWWNMFWISLFLVPIYIILWIINNQKSSTATYLNYPYLPEACRRNIRENKFMAFLGLLIIALILITILFRSLLNWLKVLESLF